MNLIHALNHWSKYHNGRLGNFSVSEETRKSCEYIINVINLFNHKDVRLFPHANGTLSFYFSGSWYPELEIDNAHYHWHLSDDISETGKVEDFDCETMLHGTRHLLYDDNRTNKEL
jgi:hypothetical protein